MNYEESYENYHVQLIQQATKNTFKFYVLPAIWLYLPIDIYLFNSRDILTSITIRMLLSVLVAIVFLHINKSRNIKSILNAITATSILTSVCMNYLFYLVKHDSFLPYAMGINITALCCLGLYPFRRNIFIILAMSFYLPNIFIVYAKSANYLSELDFYIFIAFNICILLTLYLQTMNLRKRIDEEFHSKWLLASHLSEDIRLHPELTEISNSKITSNHIARQIAHDLQSPLGALNLLVKKSSFENEDMSNLLNLVNERITGIVGDLKILYNNTKESTGTFKLNEAIEKIIVEKSLLHPGKFSLTINKDLKNTNEMNVRGDEQYFMRIISNILNNSIEACNYSCEIYITTSLAGRSVSIKISDNGQGIPQDIIKKIGTEGFSYNKPTGTGVGLYDAKLKLNEWGGNLSIDSELNFGTSIIISMNT